MIREIRKYLEMNENVKAWTSTYKTLNLDQSPKPAMLLPLCQRFCSTSDSGPPWEGARRGASCQSCAV